MEQEYNVVDLPIRVKCINSNCGKETVLIGPANVSIDYNRHIIVSDQSNVPDACPICNSELKPIGQIFFFHDGQITGIKTYPELNTEWYIFFTNCIQESQVYGSDNEHMVSTVFFKMKRGDDIEGVNEMSLACIIRQPYGENFSFETSPLEVDLPEELREQVDYLEFRDAVENYFRSIIGNNGSFFPIRGGTNIRMSTNFLMQPGFAVISVRNASGHGGW